LLIVPAAEFVEIIVAVIAAPLPPTFNVLIGLSLAALVSIVTVPDALTVAVSTAVVVAATPVRLTARSLVEIPAPALIVAPDASIPATVISADCLLEFIVAPPVAFATVIVAAAAALTVSAPVKVPPIASSASKAPPDPSVSKPEFK
jgi:hypothetical protein